MEKEREVYFNSHFDSGLYSILYGCKMQCSTIDLFSNYRYVVLMQLKRE